MRYTLKIRYYHIGFNRFSTLAVSLLLLAACFGGDSDGGSSDPSRNPSTGSSLYSGQIEKLSIANPVGGERFGYLGSLSMSGDYVLVGAFAEDSGSGVTSGAAYIYHRDPLNDSWDTGSKLVPGNLQSLDAFGLRTAIDGDFALISAANKDVGDTNGVVMPDAGTVYIYQKNTNGDWSNQTQLFAPDAQANDLFGSGVAVKGDYFIVGARGKNSNAGSAYVYYRDPINNNWNSVATLSAPDLTANDNFGTSVAISDQYAVVGASGDVGYGRIFVYARTDVNTWSAPTILRSPDVKSGEVFGAQLAIDGDYIIVGDPYDYSTSNVFQAGAAYIFQRTGSNSWDNVTKLVSTTSNTRTLFGVSVDIENDYAVVGAYAANSSAGGAYIFHRTSDANTWSSAVMITPDDAQLNDYFGHSVAINGAIVAVGAYAEGGGTGDPFPLTGAVYLFR